MKKRLTVGVVAVVAMLIAATTAFAAIDNYTAGYSFHGRSGSKSKPAALNFNQHFKLTPIQSGALTGVLTEIRTSISGVAVDATGLPACSASKINNSKTYELACSKKGLVATGSITAALGNKTNYIPAGLNCDPTLQVYYGGGHTLTFFFVTTAAHQCLNGNISTGEAPAFTASYRKAGSKLDVTIPVPSSVTDPGDGPYLAGLTSETLNWHSATVKGHHTIQSTGCSGKRHFTYEFNAKLPSGETESKAITGTAACG